eukprot:NODE_20_length_44879_cov_0.624654.p8 type:complete len:505 gc:universal NODE_20_length_44879_cov_0.624654:14453-15967(+)
MIVDISKIKSVMQTGYLFDFIKILSLFINLHKGNKLEILYSEDMCVDLLFDKSVELDCHEVESMSMISCMCTIECCIDSISMSRSKKLYKNNQINLSRTNSKKYYIRLSEFYINYPVRKVNFSFVAFANDLKLLFKVYRFLFPEKLLTLIHKQSQWHFQEGLTTIEKFVLDVGEVYHIKTDKILNKKVVGFARAGNYFIDFSQQLDERDAGVSVVMAKARESCIVNANNLNIECLERILQLFKVECKQDESVKLKIPMASSVKTSDSFKVLKNRTIVHSNPCNVNDANPTSLGENCLESKLKRSYECKSESLKISREDFSKAEIIRQVDEKFILFSVAVNAEYHLYCADQHAVDERIKLEYIISEYNQCVELTTESNYFNLQQLEMLDQTRKKITQEAKIEFHIKEMTVFFSRAPKVLVDTPQHVKRLEEIMSRFLHFEGFAKCVMPTLESIACRSAIMFGDLLNKNQCLQLLEQLKKCKNPFVCAHGRPSVVPLLKFAKKRKK